MIDVTIFERARETVAGLPSSSSATTSGHEGCLPRKDFEDLFTKVILNGKTYIQANYGLYSVGSLSGYGLKESSGGSGSGTVTIEPALTSGTLIATINGVSIYAPTASSVSVSQILTAGTAIAEINGVTLYAPTASSGGGGASSWDELTGKPAWLTSTAPGVSTFANDAGYVLSSALGALAALSTVGTGQIAKYAVTEDKIAGGAVTAYQLANAAVQTAKIADGAVTAAKLEHSGMTLWGGEVSLGEARDGDILLGSGMGVRFTDGEKTAWLRYDSANNAVYVADADGNAVNFYAAGSVSAFGFSESSGGGGSIDVERILDSGVHIATIAGVEIYAPEGGASSWGDITGKPSWLETKPSVSAFDNDAGYITSTSLYWSRNSNGEVYTDYNVVTEALTVNGGLAVNDSFTFNASGQFNDDVGISGMLECDSTAYFRGEVYIGDITDKSAKYVWLGYRGLFIEGEGSTSGNPWYGTLCTQDAYTQKSINMRYFNPYTAIQQLAVGSEYLYGTTVPSYTLSVIGQSYVNGSSIVDGTLQTTYLAVGGASRPNGFLFASPNGYFGNPSTGRYTQFGEGGDIELSHPTPFIDFHYGCSTADFTSRLIAAEDGVLMIQSATTDPALRIGNAYLRYDLANNALYVTGKDGAQVNFYATGGLSGYSALGTFDTLTNLNITGQLTAASVNIGVNSTLYENSGGSLYISAREGLYIGGIGTYYDSDGWLYITDSNELQLTKGGILRIGSTAADHGITDVYADGSYVYVTINGKRYRLTPSATTTV